MRAARRVRQCAGRNGRSGRREMSVVKADVKKGRGAEDG